MHYISLHSPSLHEHNFVFTHSLTKVNLIKCTPLCSPVHSSISSLPFTINSSLRHERFCTDLICIENSHGISAMRPTARVNCLSIVLILLLVDLSSLLQSVRQIHLKLDEIIHKLIIYGFNRVRVSIIKCNLPQYTHLAYVYLILHALCSSSTTCTQ